MASPVPDPRPTLRRRARTGALPVVLWAFGFATSMLLIGMWGRTVAVDSGTVEDAAAAIVDADLASDRIESWLETGLASATDADIEEVRSLATDVAARPEFDVAVDAIVAEFVAGLFADPGTTPVVELDDALAPLVPVVVDEASARAIPVESEAIESVLATASAIPLDAGEAASMARVVSEARALLTWVVVVAAVALLVAGGIAVALSDRRYAMVRTLSTRVVISALTYALMFRVGSWALDPDRGRSPVLGGGSVVLGSNGHIFLIAGAVAAVIAVWGGSVAYRRSRRARPRPVSPSTPPEDRATDDDTRELLPV